MGYHFVLSESAIPEKATAGERVRVALKVLNRGVAPIYNEVPLRVRLRGEKEYLFTTDVDPREWLPGEHEAVFDLPLPVDMAAGDYEIAVTLSGEDGPVVRFETQGEWDGAFLTIGRVSLS